MRKLIASLLLFFLCLNLSAQKSFNTVQQEFADLRFGMFIHFNIPTFSTDDWPDPNTPVSAFNPSKLDCNQWAVAAKSANMSYGCLTTKHHSGFCLWDTKSTTYNVMNSPVSRDVVREYVDAFRAKGLKVMLYYSILDTHHNLRPGHIVQKHIEMVKEQIRELFSNYGEITALFIDGWESPWARISYDEIPFEDIYLLIKSLQPNCLIMDLNAAKYPPSALFYSDIKSYEQNAGEKMDKENNQLASMSCLPINKQWFWKKDFPTGSVKDAGFIVNDNIIPLNKAFCNFILNVAPNQQGLIDDNALKLLKEIGSLWKNDGPVARLPISEPPVISSNIAKHKPADSSWSWDMQISDFGNDDNFKTCWESNMHIKDPWYEVDLGIEKPFNLITITEAKKGVQKYRIQYFAKEEWKTIIEGTNQHTVKIHRFERVWGSKVRVLFDNFTANPTIAELGMYNERR
jgi:alpha-L-fucosidase